MKRPKLEWSRRKDGLTHYIEAQGCPYIVKRVEQPKGVITRSETGRILQGVYFVTIDTRTGEAVARGSSEDYAVQKVMRRFSKVKGIWKA